MQPLARRLRPRLGLNQPLKLDPIRHPRRIGAEPIFVLPPGFAQLIAQDAEEPIIPASQQHIAIPRLEPAVGDDARVRGAPAPRIPLTADQAGTGQVAERGDLAIAEADVDVLALPPIGAAALNERRHDGVAGVEPRGQVGDGDADFHGAAVPFPRDVHEAHLGFDHDVVASAVGVGARLAVACDGGVDEGRVEEGEVGVGEGVAGEGVG